MAAKRSSASEISMAQAKKRSRPAAKESPACTVTPILGTMTFGRSPIAGLFAQQVTDAGDVGEIMGAFKDAGGKEIDTARVYQGGMTEIALAPHVKGLIVATKAFPVSEKLSPLFGGLRGFGATSIKKQFAQSTTALGVDCVDIYYLHKPCSETPFEESVRAANELHKAGKFRELGLSNFTAWQTVAICEFCRKNGLVQPTVYQGMYNGLARKAEEELLPALRAYGIRFYAYNPLMGGMLAREYETTDLAEGRRFDQSSRQGQMYRSRYWHDQMIKACSHVRTAASAANIALAEAALRWMVHHSALRGSLGDGVIFGCSRLSHLRANMAAMAAGPLPDTAVAAFEEAYGLVAGCVPTFARNVAKSNENPMPDGVPVGVFSK